MKYFEINPKDGYWLLGDTKLRGEIVPFERFLEGKQQFANAALPVLLDVNLEEPGREAPFSFSTMSVPIVEVDLAERLRTDLTPSMIEFVLARVSAAQFRAPAVFSSNTFAVLNVLNVIDAVDRKSSNFELWPDDRTRAGEYRSFDRLVLDARKLEGHHLFRIKGYPMILFASQFVERLLSDVESIDFTPVEVST